MQDSSDWRTWWKSSPSCATLDGMRKEEPTNANSTLHELRAEIDDIDLKIASLLSRRHGIVVEIGKQKHVLGKKVFDDERERFVLNRVTAQAQDAKGARFIQDVYERILQGSRDAQAELVQDQS